MNKGDFSPTPMVVPHQHEPISYVANSMDPTEVETYQEEPTTSLVAESISSPHQMTSSSSSTIQPQALVSFHFMTTQSKLGISNQILIMLILQLKILLMSLHCCCST